MTQLTHCHAAQERAAFPWQDLAIVLGATVLAALVCMRIEFAERVFDFSRNWEHWQVDELAWMLFVLAIGMAWFAWRRYREARRELIKRRAAERRLARLLDDHRRLAQQHVQLQESERKALARELHDELGQYLNAIKTDAVVIQSKASDPDSVGARAAGAIVEHCDHLQRVVRGLIGKLRPVALDVLGLRAALDHLLDHARTRVPACTLDVAIEGELDDLDEETSLTLYRLIQEGLTNVAKHAGARRVELRIARERRRNAPDQIHLSLADDGRGMDPNRRTDGLGLIGMRERVEMLAGELHVEGAPDRGVRITARLPASAPASASPTALAA